MYSLPIEDITFIMAAGLFALGLVTFAAGLIILVSKVIGRNVRVIADQTVKLAQKGMAEDVSGLVGNASALLNALNQMIATATGVGVFLILIGMALMGASYWLVTQIS
jgi:hypothetical protein